MKQEDRIQKSFDFVQEATKQIITLATLILGLMMTFFKELAYGYDSIKNWFPWSLIVFLISILAGIFVLLNLSGTLGNIKKIETNDVTPYRKQILIWLYVQIFFFLGGLLLGIIMIWQSNGEVSSIKYLLQLPALQNYLAGGIEV